MMSARIYRSYGIKLVRHSVFYPLHKTFCLCINSNALCSGAKNLYDGVLLILDLP